MINRVLIVDDDPSMLRLLGKYLTAAGREVLSVSNGAEALHLLRTQNVRLVITDWMMPGMDGLEFCRAVRSSKDTRSVYVVVLTGHTDKGRLVEALEAGADDFLPKPPDRQELMARLKAGERILRLQDDLVEQARVAQERDQLRNAVTAFEQVLGVVGHELRTPLAGTRAMTEFLLEQEARTAETLNEFLARIHEQVVHMGDIVNDLLDTARLNGGAVAWQWSEMQVARVCREALETIGPLVDRQKVSVTLEVAPPDLRMRGDPGAIRRLLVNLLSNAQKHTQAGSIDVLARAAARDGAEWVEFEVRDTGHGIEAKIADRLGVAFALNSGALGDRHIPGSGLGLSICRGIVAAHGGRMYLASRKGGGTTVRVVLRADLPDAVRTRNVPPITTEVGP